MSAKKRIVFYGNCQAPALAVLAGMSSNFSREFYVDAVSPVYSISESEQRDLLGRARASDCIVCQPVSPQYRGSALYATETLLEHAKSDCKSILFPSLHFSGYNPELIYLRNQPYPDFIDYTDAFAFYGYLKGLTIEDTLRARATLDVEAARLSRSHAEDAVNELTKRELDNQILGRPLDIQVSQFISERYRSERLFHTMNHPGRRVLNEVLVQLFGLLDLDVDFTVDDVPDYLSMHVFPQYASVAWGVGGRLIRDEQCRISFNPIETKVLIGKYFKHFESLGIRPEHFSLFEEQCRTQFEIAEPMFDQVMKKARNLISGTASTSAGTDGGSKRAVASLKANGFTESDAIFYVEKAIPQSKHFMIDLIGELYGLFPTGTHYIQVLDVGSQTGAGANLLRELYAPETFSRVKMNVLAQDMDPRSREVASILFPELDYICAEISALPEKNWDLVVCSHVVEHVPDTPAFIASLKRLAKKHVILAFPYGEQADALIPGHLHSLGQDFLRSLNPLRYRIYDGMFWHQSPCAIAILSVD